MNVAEHASHERWRAAAIALFAFATRALFVYRQGMAEPDAVVMAAGMAMGVGADGDFGGAILYGRQVSPGMYFVVRALYPLFFDSSAHMMGFLNWLSIASFAGLAWLLYRFFRASMPASAATAALLVLLTTPVVWESSTYFHPLVPASLLLAGAALAWRRFDAPRPRMAWLVACALLASCALVIRVEIVWVVPAALAAVAMKPGRARRLAALVAVVVAGLAVYAVVARLAAGERPAVQSLRHYAAMIQRMYLDSFSLRSLTRAVPWMAMGMGLATLAAAGVAFARFLTMRRKLAGHEAKATTARIVIGLLWILPAVLFWLPVPTPILRHYFLSTMGLAWLAGCLVPAVWSPRRIYRVAIVVAVLNLALPEAAYRLYNRAHPDVPKTANGAFFYYHQQVEGRIARQQEMARRVVDTMQAPGSPGVFAQVDWEGYAYVVYQLYTRVPGARRISGVRPTHRTTYHVYRSDGAELRLMQTIGLARGESKDAVRTAAAQAAADGLPLFLSRDALLAGIDPASLAPAVVVY